MSLHLPKQRNRASFRLARDDLTSRRTSVNLDDFDFTAVAQTYVPHQFSAVEIPEIPVYNRQKNRMARFSRVVSMPENGASSQPAVYFQPDNSKSGGEFKESGNDYRNNKKDSGNDLISVANETCNPKSFGSEKDPIAAENRNSMSPQRNIRCYSERPISHNNSKKPELSFENPEFLLNTTRNPKEHLLSKKQAEFPSFKPQLTGQITTIPQSSTEPKSHHRQKSSQASIRSPIDSASSHYSAPDSQFSVNTCASSETAISSVEICDPLDIISYYATERNNEEKETPPKPPKHSRRVVSEMTRPSGRPIDFCLDMGAEYEKSRFMIPVENQVAKTASKSPKNCIFVKTRDSRLPYKEEAPSQRKSGRRSISSRELISAFKKGLNIDSGK